LLLALQSVQNPGKQTAKDTGCYHWALKGLRTLYALTAVHRSLLGNSFTLLTILIQTTPLSGIRTGRAICPTQLECDKLTNVSEVLTVSTVSAMCKLWAALTR
jgi:hypothetical protein